MGASGSPARSPRIGSSPRRPDARHTRKSPERRRDGYRAHLAAEPETGIITDEELTRAAGPESSDPAVAERFVAAETTRSSPTAPRHRQRRRPTCEWYGDSAYGTGDLRDVIATAGHLAVRKPSRCSRRLRAGSPRRGWRHGGLPRRPRPADQPHRVATFGAACRTCPLRSRCTASKTGRKLVLHAHDALLRQARRDWAADPGLREAYRRHRPNVERVISQLASRGGRRLKLRYPGCGGQQRLA
jgi:hypothetical protein